MKKAPKIPEARNAASVGGDGLTAKEHTDMFAQAVRTFASGDYHQAAAMFEQTAAGPLMSVNESAQMYRKMCMQRLELAEPKPQSAEDYYHLGVSLFNAHRYREARERLEVAVSQHPQPHYLYALALAEGMLGSVAKAAQQLRQAIEADPGIRSMARNDADFAPLLEHAVLREILSGDPTTK